MKPHIDLGLPTEEELNEPSSMLTDAYREFALHYSPSSRQTILLETENLLRILGSVYITLSKRYQSLTTLEES